MGANTPQPLLGLWWERCGVFGADPSPALPLPSWDFLVLLLGWTCLSNTFPWGHVGQPPPDSRCVGARPTASITCVQVKPCSDTSGKFTYHQGAPPALLLSWEDQNRFSQPHATSGCFHSSHRWRAECFNRANWQRWTHLPVSNSPISCPSWGTEHGAGNPAQTSAWEPISEPDLAAQSKASQPPEACLEPQVHWSYISQGCQPQQEPPVLPLTPLQSPQALCWRWKTPQHIGAWDPPRDECNKPTHGVFGEQMAIANSWHEIWGGGAKRERKSKEKEKEKSP